jgi:leader peptidase (prepilin peptidase) / N-methyltransferase
VNPPLSAELAGALAVVGLLAGYPQRAIIASYTSAVPEPGRSPEPAASSNPPAGARSTAPTTSRPTPRAASRPTPRAASRTVPPWPAVGAITAVLLAGLAARIWPAQPHPALPLAATCWLTLCAVPLVFTDAAVRRLPDPLTGAACAGTLLLLLLAAASGAGPWSALLRALAGGLALAGFYFLLVLISPSGMGLGDVKLAASLGVLLAWFSWPTLLAGAVTGFLLAGLYGAALLVTRRATRKHQLPFGPFMIAGTLAVLLIWPAAR